jgi:hypothetical protein
MIILLSFSVKKKKKKKNETDSNGHKVMAGYCPTFLAELQMCGRII